MSKRVIDKAKKRKQALEWWRKFGKNKDADGKRSILDPTENRVGVAMRAHFLRKKDWNP